MDQERRILKPWTLKLPVEIIEQFEKMFEQSGKKFKNEYFEDLLASRALEQIENGEHAPERFHPELMKQMSGDLFELARLTQMINTVFLHQLEKFSIDKFEHERLQRELNEKNAMLKDKHRAPGNHINELLQEMANQNFSHMLFTGDSYGKTQTLKLEIKKAIEEKKQVIVFDLLGEYQSLVENYGGTFIPINKTNRFNPMELYFVDTLTQDVLFAKRQELKSLFLKLVERDLFSSNEALSILDQCLRSVYSLSEPMLGDLMVDFRHSGEMGREIADALEPFTFGILNEFNGKRSIHTKKVPLIVFGFHELHKSLQIPAIRLALEFVSAHIRQGVFGETLLVFDEAWSLLQDVVVRERLTLMLERSRKYKTQILCSTSHLKDALNFTEFIAQFSTFVFFRQKIKGHSDWGFLSDHEIDTIEHLKKGEALLKRSRNDSSITLRFEPPKVKEEEMLF